MKITGVWRNTLSCLLLLAMSAFGAAWFGYAHLTGLVQGRLRGLIGNNFSIGEVSAHWNRVELTRIRIARQGKGTFDRRFAIDRVVLRPRLLSLFTGNLELGDIDLENPYLLLEITPDGSFMPLLQPSSQKSPATGPAMPIVIDGIHISGGKIELLDWHVGQRGAVGLSNPAEHYNLLRLQDICLDVGKLNYPPADQMTKINLSLKSLGGGELTLSGKLAPKTLDSRLRLDIKALNILNYRPYFLKKGDLNVTKGSLTAGCDIAISSRQLKAPGTIVLTDLTFDRAGTKGVLMGIPTWAMVKLMSDNQNGLKVDFALSGSLDNPHFSIRQSLLEQVATALSSKIGISSAVSVGKGIIGIGEKGLKGLFGVFGGK